MNNISKFLLLSLFFVLVFTSLRATDTSPHKEYYSVIDFGSSGSRVYLYEADSQKDGLSVMHEIKFKDNKLQPGLNAFMDSSQGINNYVKKLTDALKKKLNEDSIDIEDVSLYAYGTAGVRIIPPYAKAVLFEDIKEYLKRQKFKNLAIGELPEQYEGIFDWISVNYQKNTLACGKKTYGVLDMGGGSTEIAFEVAEHNADVYTFNLGKHQYSVYSKSWLGLGMDYMRNQVINVQWCWPTGFNLPSGDGIGKANFIRGVDDLYMLVAYAHRADKTIMPDFPEGTKFVGLGGFRYITFLPLLHLKSTYSVKDIENAGMAASSYSWMEINKNFHKDKEYLYATMFETEYLTALLVYGYGFKSYDTIETDEVSWTLGLVVYLTSGNII